MRCRAHLFFRQLRMTSLRFFAKFMHDGRDSLSDYFLRVRLARINNVVDDFAATKIRPRYFRLSFSIRLSSCYPCRMSAVISPKRFVVKIEAELTQLPKLVRDVF